MSLTFAPNGNAHLPAERLRVVLLSDAAQGRSGVGTYYDDLADQIRSYVDDVLLLAPPMDPDGSYRGLHMPLPGDPTQRLYFPWVGDLRRQIVEFRPNVIVSSTPWIYGLMGLPMARETGAVFCVGYHTQFDKIADLYWRGAVSRFVAPIFHFWDRILFPFADRVLVHNEELIEDARDGGARSVTLMGTPAATPFLDMEPPPPPREIRSVVFVGRLAPEKRVVQVLEAAREHPEITFRLVGDGPLAGEVADAAASLSNVEPLGWQDRAGVLATLDRSDAMVLPSRFETFGTAAYEAMLRRRAVIVSPGCGLLRWRELEPGLFPMQEGEQVTQTLNRLKQGGYDLAGVAEAGMQGARALNEQTIHHWVSVLVDTLHVRHRR